MLNIAYILEKSGIRLNDGYDHKHKFYVSGLNVLDKNDYLHPTCKPIEFVQKHIEHVTQPGDVVLDCFLGSGTTALAARRANRKYIGFEINPDYYKIAVDRMQGWNQHGEMNLLDAYGYNDEGK